MRRLVRKALVAVATVTALVQVPGPASAAGIAPKTGVPSTAGAAPAPSSASAPGLALPRPTGRRPVGTVSLHLVDRSRRDPWVAAHPFRELMVQLWYPATRTAGFPCARYMPARSGRLLDAQTAQALRTTVPAGTFHALRTHSRLGAPVAYAGRSGRPVVLFSPGDGMDRSSLTGLAEDLAGHGFVVVGIDDTHDSGQVEFPGGRVEVAQPAAMADPDRETQVRAADARFVLDQLTRLNSGADPDAEHRRIPTFRHSLDLSRVGMFGHSHGAEATAETMLQDDRISAGVELDGGVGDRVAAAGLDRSFMVVSGDSAAGHPKTEENLTALWPHLTGWSRWLRLRGAGHLAFTDFETFAQELGTAPDGVQGKFGTIDPRRAVDIERTYVLAFFTERFDHRHEPILDRPSRRYPEVVFER